MIKLEHFALNVPNPLDAAEWYSGVIGLHVVEPVRPGANGRFLRDGSGVMLELYHRADVAVPDYFGMSPSTLHIAFAVDRLETAIERLVGAGAFREGQIETTAAGDRLAFVRDPWGLPLQLVERRVSPNAAGET